MSRPREEAGVSSAQSLVVLATGGTGGHVYPAVAVAHELRARGVQVAVVGQQGGMEARLVPAEGFPFYGVRAGKWDRRRPDPRGAFGALLGLTDAVRLLRTTRPRLVVGFGGFASFPGLAAAQLIRLPIVLHEGNAFPGRVTRWFAGRAVLVAISQAEAAWHLSGVPTLHVGHPTREQRTQKSAARAALGLPQEGPVTLVMGGSQGSATLNESVPRAFAALLTGMREGLTVLHSSGERHLEAVRRRTEGLPGYHVTPYVDATLAWSAADLAITRAGISTLAEAAFHEVPLLMVPLPSSAEDHQVHNARAVEAAGAGAVVLERELHTLPERWRALLQDEVRCPAAAAARKRSPAGAASRFAELIGELVRRADRHGPYIPHSETGECARQETV